MEESSSIGGKASPFAEAVSRLTGAVTVELNGVIVLANGLVLMIIGNCRLTCVLFYKFLELWY